MIEYTREMNRNYVRIMPGEDAVCTGYCMKMAENNSIDGLLAFHSQVVNNKVSYLYDISGCEALDEKYSDLEFTWSDIDYITDFLKKIFDSMERFMLDPEGLIFNPKYIFCRQGTDKWEIIYNIYEGRSVREELKSLFEFILGRLDHKSQQAVLASYGIYKRICQEEIPLNKLFEIENKCEGQDCAGISLQIKEQVNGDIPFESMVQEVEKPGKSKFPIALMAVGIVAGMALLVNVYLACAIFLAGCVMTYILLFRPEEERMEIVSEHVEIPFSVNNAELECEENQGTKILGIERIPRLVRQGVASDMAGEYPLIDFPSVIGSGPQADISINEEGVSRVHARITKEGEMMFIKDMNSTNGTWVNGRRLLAYEICPIKCQDVIIIAKSVFSLLC